ncbi:MAG: hypothetical protein ACJ71J_03375, partial [Nitrososphaeraceae archaeon]
GIFVGFIRGEVYMYNKSAFCPCCGMQQGYPPVVENVRKYLERGRADMLNWLITMDQSLDKDILCD